MKELDGMPQREPCNRKHVTLGVHGKPCKINHCTPCAVETLRRKSCHPGCSGNPATEIMLHCCIGNHATEIMFTLVAHRKPGNGKHVTLVEQGKPCNGNHVTLGPMGNSRKISNVKK